MHRLIRIVVLVALIALVLFLALAGLAALFINPNDYKPRIQEAVFRATGKTLDLQGDLSLSVFPLIRLEAGPAEVRDDAEYGNEPFLSVKKVQASVELLPLVRGQVSIAEILLTDMTLKLAVNHKGEPNWRTHSAPANAEEGASAVPGDSAPSAPSAPSGGRVTSTPLARPQPTDGAGSDAETLPLQNLHIGSLRLENARISYHDFGSGDFVAVALESADLESLLPGAKTTLALRGEISGREKTRSAAFSLDVSCTLPTLAGQEIPFGFKGSLDTDSVTGEGSLIPLSLAGDRPFTLRGDFHITRLDLDRYLPKDAGQKAEEQPRVLSRQEKREMENASKASARSFSRVAGGLVLDLRVSAETLIIHKLPLLGIKAEVVAENGEIHAGLTADSVAKGALSATASITANGEDVASKSAGQLKDARLEELLLAVTGKGQASGALSLDWDVTGNGVDWNLLAPSLAGKASLLLTNGLVPGFELIPSGIQGVQPARMDIGIERFSGSWTIGNGVAANKDLKLAAGAISATGSGRFMLPEKRLDYSVNITAPGLPVIPARISGPVTAPVYTVDGPALLRNTATGILNAPVQAGQGAGTLGEHLGRELEQGVRGLINR